MIILKLELLLKNIYLCFNYHYWIAVLKKIQLYKLFLLDRDMRYYLAQSIGVVEYTDCFSAER